MTDFAVTWLVRLVTTLIVAAGSYWAGDHNRNNAWLAKQTTQATNAHAEYQKEEQRGDGAVTDLAGELQKQKARYTELQGKFNALTHHHPLVVSFPGLACAGLGAAALPPATAVTQDPGPGPVLSNGAVWMWNSALAGSDQPANTCGADDPASQACAAVSGITVQDAWSNHTLNAESCAQDRLRYQRLIDFLEGKKP